MKILEVAKLKPYTEEEKIATDMAVAKILIKRRGESLLYICH